MTYCIYNSDLNSEVCIEENLTGFRVCISVTDLEENQTQSTYIDKKELHDFIGALLHVQSKMNKKR